MSNSGWAIQLPGLRVRTAVYRAPKTADMLRAERCASIRRLPFRKQQIVNLQLLVATLAATAMLLGVATLLAAPFTIRRLSLWLGA